MQRTFGGDKRFELDSRFLESDDEDSGHDDYNKRKETAKVNAQESLSRHDDDKEDDIRENLKHEKEMAMKVLSSILGGDFRAKFGHGESQEKVPEFRYKHVSIALITVISGFDIQTRLVGHSALCRMVLTHQPRLHAFLNSRKLDRRLNCDNSYFRASPFHWRSELERA